MAREIELVRSAKIGSIPYEIWLQECECGARFEGGRIAAPEVARCPKCRDAESAARAKANAIEQRQAKTLESIPRRYRWASLDAPELKQRVQPATVIARATAAAAEAHSVVLLGASGTGKTSLACALLRAIAARRDTAGLFTSAFQLAKARAEHQLGGGEAPAIDRAMRASVLLLDELGAEMSRNTAVAEVIHKRHEDERPTIFTSGFSVAAIEKQYGEGIHRRIFEQSAIIKLRGVPE